MTLLIIFGHFLKIRVLEIRLRHIFLILANYFVNFPNFHQEKDKCDFIFRINRYKIYVCATKQVDVSTKQVDVSTPNGIFY